MSLLDIMNQGEVGPGKGEPPNARKKKATDAHILAAYATAGSVKGAGALLGMCGQSVHERLVKMGANNHINTFSPAHDDLLRKEYERHADDGKLAILAKAMGRSKTTIARRARELGLTDPHRKKPYLAEIVSKNVKKWHQENEHPRGMLGKRHNASALNKFSNRMFKQWHAKSAAEKIKSIEKQKKSWKQGWRLIGGRRIFFRSAWEANYARYLEWLRLQGKIDSWEFESKTFWFDKIKRGVRSYLPDFCITEYGIVETYHEIKGWMDARSKTKLKRMTTYYPGVRVVVIDGKQYKAIAKTMAPIIKDWE